jgi:cellulose synthase/poly-beta-1,6-N-acetylglucosamine synthase-like glycosyltransferase
MARRHHNVRIYQLSSRHSLGACLNFATARARYPYVSKMDDDEYYAPYYLHGLVRSFRKSNADVVGKRSLFIHLAGSRMLLQRFGGENRYVSVLAGGTITFKKRVWQKVKFSRISLGEDTKFCRDCRRKGFKLYSGDRYNFCALRRKETRSHTWKATDRQLIRDKMTRIIARRCDHYRKYVVKHF